jgi:hypothetical protein
MFSAFKRSFSKQRGGVVRENAEGHNLVTVFAR